MTNFITLADKFFVSPQITIQDIEIAKTNGIDLIINNRPDNEEPGQLPSALIEQKATEAGIAYVHIPVGTSGISEKHLNQFDDALAKSAGTVLAYCRSGTRSTILRAMALARNGTAIDQIISEAAAAGYNLSGQRGTLASLTK